MIIQTEMEKKDEYVKKLQVFFTGMDENGDGEISLDEFVQHVDHPEVIAFANALEIDALDAKLFFQVLSDNGKRSIDLETFVVGCIKLKGAAKSMDLLNFFYSYRVAVQRQNLFADDCLARLESISADMRSWEIRFKEEMGAARRARRQQRFNTASTARK